MTRTVPKHLVDEILAGRCVAFVGAGVTAPALLGWRDLLTELATCVSEPRERGEIEEAARTARTSMELEATGQQIKDALGGEAFEREVQRLLGDRRRRPEGTRLVERRVELLDEIPFKAVLTTNQDPFLRRSGAVTTRPYREVLRDRRFWWEHRDWSVEGAPPLNPLLKLHGDANGDPAVEPVVLARSDYRSLLYEQATYTSFVRAILGTYTVLFLGFSFSDAYLNELRSQALSYLLDGRSKEPLAYAVLEDRSSAMRRYFLEHEGIEILHFDTKEDETEEQGWEGFDAWLEAIHGATSAVERLRTLLHEGGRARRVVWLDPHQGDNEVGLAYLSEAGADLEAIRSVDELSEPDHAGAALLITHFGWDPPGDPVAVRVLKKVASWPERPPVIVFATRAHARENRQRVLRHGAWAYAWSWGELFRLIQELFQ